MKNNLIYYLLALYAIICTLSIIFFNGTGDVEDSIAHYLFAKNAPFHPELYFDHWAKPVYVLLASPFAQLGFTGLKIFNSLVNLVTIFLTYKIAVELKVKKPIVAAVIMMFAPLYYVLTFSGLTEPLFALFTAVGILLCLREKHLAACIVISFLPYVRSEGLILIGVFGLYFILKRMWKLLPWLLSGSALYGIAGFFVHGTFLWVFSKIPYASLDSVYGSGSIFHFVTDLIHVTGVPIYFLFWAGFLGMIIRLIKRTSVLEEQVLILLGFVCFFIAHSLFWYLGIFNSMGLKRVMLGVMPMIAIVGLQGFNLATEWLGDKRVPKNILQAALIIYLVVFPFTPNPSAIHWQKDIMLLKEQELAQEVSDVIRKQAKPVFPLIYNHHYLSVTLNVDHFDPSRKRKLYRDQLELLQKGTLIIWDSRFAEKESGISEAEMDGDTNFVRIYSCQGPERFGTMVFVVYQKK